MLVVIKHNGNSFNFNLNPGTTVGDIMDHVSETVNLPEGLIKTINGVTANDSQQVFDDTIITLQQPQGVKG